MSLHRLRWMVRVFRLRTILLCTIYSVVAVFVFNVFHTDPSDQRRTRRTPRPIVRAGESVFVPSAPSQSRVNMAQFMSTLTCNYGERTMMVDNLYVVAGAYHAYVGPDYRLPAQCCAGAACTSIDPHTGHLESITVTLGIGFGGSLAVLHLADFAAVSTAAGKVAKQILSKDELADRAEEAAIKAKSKSGSGKSSTSAAAVNATELDTAHKLVIYVHASNPPEHFTPLARPRRRNVRYLNEPTIFFCTLWDNFFRTIYAGVGAWFTMMNYRVFFPHQHRFVLVAPSPAKFDHLLQMVTPNPLMREHELLSQTVAGSNSIIDGDVVVLKAAVFGISKDVRLGEIDVETDRGWRYIMRSFALRSFCGKIKTGLLTQREDKAGQHVQVDTAASHDEFDEIYNKLIVAMNKRDVQEGHTSEQHYFIQVMNEAITSSARHKLNRPNDKLSMTFIIREGSTRNIVNADQLIAGVKARYPQIDVKALNFDHFEFDEQVEIVYQTDIMVSVHGAALAHALFMRPETYMIELFPFGFRKTIYQNLAKSMGVYYSFWENTHPENTVFYWDYVEQHRFTRTPKQQITRRSTDWYNMDSKNYWRNQDTRVELAEFMHTLENVVWLHETKHRGRYLLYQPWEQVNNQLIGLKSACAVARLLDRVLIIPDVGRAVRSRRSRQKQSQSQFDPEAYAWSAFFRYFDLKRFLSAAEATALSNGTATCRFMSVDNFIALNQGKRLGKIRYHHLADGATSEKQLENYVQNVLDMDHDGLERGTEFYHLSADTIRRLHAPATLSASTDRVLTLSSMFWYFDFGVMPPYGVPGSTRRKDEYVDYMQVPLYAQMMRSLAPHTRVQHIANLTIRRLRHSLIYSGSADKHHQQTFKPLTDSEASSVVTVHVRRGDYLQKCERQFLFKDGADTWSTDPADMDLFRRCYPSDQDLARRLLKLADARQTQPASQDLTCPTVFYISTNDPSAGKASARRKKAEAELVVQSTGNQQVPVDDPNSDNGGTDSDNNDANNDDSNNNNDNNDKEEETEESADNADSDVALLGDTYQISNLPRLLPANLRRCVFFSGDVVPRVEELSDTDAALGLSEIDRTLIDQWVGVLSDAFVGNLWSSFSRHVVEWRQVNYPGDYDGAIRPLTDDVVTWL